LSLLKNVNEEIRAPIFCNQVEFHPFIDQLDLLDYAIENDILLTAYSPLAQSKVNENSVIKEIAGEYNKTPSQIALRWLIEQENVVAIPKSSSKKHLKENFNVFDFQLTDEHFEQIDGLDKSMRLVNPSFAPDWD
jgi:2,5-diketo-D-gluconate reductase B